MYIVEVYFLYLSNDLRLQRSLQKEGFQRVDYKRSSLPSILCTCRFNCETVHYTWLCTNAVGHPHISPLRLVKAC